MNKKLYQGYMRDFEDAIASENFTSDLMGIKNTLMLIALSIFYFK